MACADVHLWRVPVRRVLGWVVGAVRRPVSAHRPMCAALLLLVFARLATAEPEARSQPQAQSPPQGQSKEHAAQDALHSPVQGALKHQQAALEHQQAGLVHQIVLAASTGSPYPDVDNALPIDTAYAMQRAVIAELFKQSPVAGFKAGLTDAAGRQRFAAAAPISGALFASGRLGSRATVQLDADDQLMIELEVGYVLGRAVTKALAPSDDPFEYVAEINAVVELPNLNFVAQPALVDVIASNVSAQQFIVGARQPLLSALILDDLRVRLARDDVQIAEGVGRTAQGGQRAALRWLINSRLAQGDTLAAGQLLITGALAGMVPAQPGHYRAVFGALGIVEFTMKSLGGNGAGGSATGPRTQRLK